MKKITTLLVILGLLCAQTQAATIITRGSIAARAYGFMKNKAVSSYTGPGDIVSGATAWYGLRAYNAAYAASAGKAVSLRRASDNTTCDFNVATSGALGVSASGCSAGSGLSLAAFATTDATCTGTAASSTTLTVTGCSSTPHVGSTITGTGFSQPVYATAVSVSAGSGTITMNTAQTVTSASTTLTYALFIPTWYDQSGNGSDATQATAGNQPQLIPSYSGARPCVRFSIANSNGLFSTISTLTQPTSYSFVWSAVTTINGGGTQSLMSTFSSGSQQQVYYNAATQLVLYSGSFLTDPNTYSINTKYATSALFNNASSNIKTNSFTTSGSTSTGGTSTTLGLGSRPGNSYQMDGYMCEGGVWPSDTSASFATMISNQRAYWGF